MSNINQQNYSSHEDDVNNVTPELLRPVTSNNGPVPNRAFYPLKEHQEEFDELERKYGPAPPPFSLNMLVDGENLNAPPQYKYAVIIKCAILGSPRYRLTLREIRIAMCRRFAYFSMPESTGWCNTIRHILSVEDDFERVPRPKTADDSGSWWQLTANAEPPDLTPTPHRSKRATQASSSSSRSKSSQILVPSRRKKAEPWMDSMTTTFSTSEAQDREEFYREYYARMQGGTGGSVNPRYQNQQGSSSEASSSTAHLTHHARSSETAVNVPGEPLPALHSLGLLDLGTRSGGWSHQFYSHPPASTPYQCSQFTHHSTRDEDDEYYEDDDDDDE